MSENNYSIVEYYSEHEGYPCGYCKCTDTTYSHGMWAHRMTVKDYQDLIDRGWRRSGRYCYKPTMHVTCCPMYTIKCEALNFKISKSQKKVIKRFHRFLVHGTSKLKDDGNSAGSSESLHEPNQECYEDINTPDLQELSKRAKQNEEKARVTSLDPSLLTRIGANAAEAVNQQEIESNQEGLRNNTQVPVNNEISSIDSNRIIEKEGTAPKKAKLIRLERKQQKLLSKGYSKEDVEKMLSKKQPVQGKSLEEHLNEPLPKDSAHKIEIRLVRSCPPSREFEQSADQAHEVYSKYQMAIHKEPAEKCSPSQYKRFLVASPLELKLVLPNSEEFKKSVSESEKLYAKYQIAIHKESIEECNSQAFYEFLVHSPLEPWKPRGGPPHGYGSFHQQYWLDGRLIAVAVLDILPYCVSSVYFYYDPDYSHLSMGTYASLREIALVRSLNQFDPELKYYYMGFYIHTCPKMRYKASYSPSLLLCPETYTWHQIEPCQRKLDKKRYSRFEDDPTVKDKDGEVIVPEVLVLSNRQAMPYFVYMAMNRHSRSSEEVAQYARLVGMKCAKRMLLVRDRE